MIAPFLTVAFADPRVNFAAHCAACHGAEANGRLELGAPALAGAPAWYVAGQVRLFRSERRATLPAEAATAMTSAASTLRTSELEEVAVWLSSLASRRDRVSTTGDAAKGRELYRSCDACHGANGEGNEVLGAPSLTWQPTWALVDALRGFEDQRRGIHPDDSGGAQMRAIVAGLDRSEFGDLAAFVVTLGEVGDETEVNGE